MRSCERYSKKFHDNNFQDLPQPKKPLGKARKVSTRSLAIFRREVEMNPRIPAKQLKEQKPVVLENVSLRTVQRILKRDLHYKWRCAWKKPIQTCRQIKNRVKFGKKNKYWTPAKCKKVLWSDESTFTVTGNRIGKIRRGPGSDALNPKYLCGTAKHPDKIMVWAVSAIMAWVSLLCYLRMKPSIKKPI